MVTTRVSTPMAEMRKEKFILWRRVVKRPSVVRL